MTISNEPPDVPSLPRFEPPAPLPPQPGPPPMPQASPFPWKWVLIIGALLILVCCACTAVAGWLTYRGISAASVQVGDARKVLESYMRYMEQKQVDQAAALFSNQVNRASTLSSLQNLISGNTYALFEGFSGLSIQETKLNTSYGTGSNELSGEIIELNGTIQYTGKSSGRFESVLHRENNIWKIYSIQVSSSSGQ